MYIKEEENQIIVHSIKKNNHKLYEKNEFNDFLIHPQIRFYLKYTINLILGFNETIQLDLVLKNELF